MKTLVVYYSNSGSNKFLAEKIATALKCEIEAIKPRLNIFPVLLIFSLIKKSLGIKTLGHTISSYDRIVLCGPIWMGTLVSPLRDFINKHRATIKRLYFVTCCASSYEAKNVKFGHGFVFRIVEDLLGNKCAYCGAFPIGLVLAPDKQKDNNAVLKTRLSDANFTGEIQTRFEDLMKKLAE